MTTRKTPTTRSSKRYAVKVVDFLLLFIYVFGVSNILSSSTVEEQGRLLMLSESTKNDKNHHGRRTTLRQSRWTPQTLSLELAENMKHRQEDNKEAKEQRKEELASSQPRQDDDDGGRRRPRRRKPIFYHHISKAGGTHVIALALRNGEVPAPMRFLKSPCRHLTDDHCLSSNVTFVQLEGSLENLTAQEKHILFVEKRFITLTQLRQPRTLEESWFKEIKYGFQSPKIQNKTFAQYLDSSFTCPLKREHSLLQFLGETKHYGKVQNLSASQETSLHNLDLFDLVTVLEEPKHNHDLFRRIFGWTNFKHKFSSRTNKTPTKKNKKNITTQNWPLNNEIPLSKSAEIMLKERLSWDTHVYDKAVVMARQCWLDWMQSDDPHNTSSSSTTPKEEDEDEDEQVDSSTQLPFEIWTY